MAGEVNVDIGTGTTIAFATSSYSAELLSLDISGLSREAIETSHMGTAAPTGMANKTYIPGDLTDPGEIAVTWHFDPGTEPPIDAVAEVITITWPVASSQSVAATWAGSGFLVDMSIADPMEDKMILSATIKMSGTWTLTQGTT